MVQILLLEWTLEEPQPKVDTGLLQFEHELDFQCSQIPHRYLLCLRDQGGVYSAQRYVLKPGMVIIQMCPRCAT